MSRGWGFVQKYLFSVVGHAEKPMTFDEIWVRAFPDGSFEGDTARALGKSKVGMARSLRRALRKLVDDGLPLAIATITSNRLKAAPTPGPGRCGSILLSNQCR
jgi:hypothetical protein